MELDKRLYLIVPYKEKDIAKERGARWDADAKFWYIEANLDPLEFQKWWGILEDTYEDKEHIKSMGGVFSGKLRAWYVPSNLKFDKFKEWWPAVLKEYIFEDCYILEKCIFRGGQSDVFQARSIKGRNKYAVKLFLSGDTQELAKDLELGFQKETRALFEMDNSKYVMKVQTAGTHPLSKRKFVIMPWMPITLKAIIGKSSEEIIRLLNSQVASTSDHSAKHDREIKPQILQTSNRKQDRWVELFSNYLLPLLDGIIHCHKNGFYHRDIKPDNIFLRPKKLKDKFIFEVVLGDFGIGKNFANPIVRNRTLVGNYSKGWRPEKDKMEKEETWDLYSWAVVSMSLVTGILPQTPEDFDKIQEKQLLAPLLGEQIFDLLSQAKSSKAKERPKDIREFRKDIRKYTAVRAEAIGV
tara:strand:- start:508 stop:1740 length:1233 start_codon:yes stop_codon:yes gene_type:complete